jgi:hypothetical protein
VRRADLLDIVPSPEHERYLKHRNFFGMMGYTVSLVVAFFSAGAALVLCTGVLVYYATPAREDVVEPGTRPL